MSAAYKCDRCKELKEGESTSIFMHGDSVEILVIPDREEATFCQPCADIISRVLEGDDE